MSLYSTRVRDHMMIAHSLSDPFFGPAANLHGATYVVDAEFRAAQLNSVAVVIDIGLAHDCLRQVLKTLNFCNLDAEERFAGRLTTTEFLAKYIHDELGRLVDHAFDGELKVTLHESHVAAASYEGPVTCRAALPKVSALMPAIHHRQTGGSVFNRRILESLGQSVSVSLHVDGGSPADPEAGVWIVDSLCLDAGAALLGRRPDARGILIAHYLKVLDSRHWASDAAQTELDALRAYSAAIATSEYSAEALRRRGYTGRVEVIPPGLDAAYRSAPAERPAEGCRILTVASLLPDKGLMDLISVLESLEDWNWSWELIGDDALDLGFTSDFQERLRSSTIAARVTQRGAIEAGAVLEAYDRAHVFVLPTRFESCSIVTMEAMARGLPVAAFRVGGLAGLLPDRSRLQLSAAGDTAGFREVLLSLISNRRLRLACGEANRMASERFPSWEDAGAKVREMLRAYA